MTKNSWDKKIFVSLTGKTEKDWQTKLKEINSLGLKTVALFLEMFSPVQRQKIYQALEKSSVKHIPLIHIRNDMTLAELKYLCQRYHNPCLTIHESSFGQLDRWIGFHKFLYLEMNYNNRIPHNVALEKIGGFCIDLSHFKAAEEKWAKEFEFIVKKKDKKIFKCNHLNGYSYEKNSDIHTISSLKEFAYLKTLPQFIFGNIIAIEVFNSIKEQLKFKKHIINLLQKN